MIAEQILKRIDRYGVECGRGELDREQHAEAIASVTGMRRMPSRVSRTSGRRPSSTSRGCSPCERRIRKIRAMSSAVSVTEKAKTAIGRSSDARPTAGNRMPRTLPQAEAASRSRSRSALRAARRRAQRRAAGGCGLALSHSESVSYLLAASRQPLVRDSHGERSRQSNRQRRSAWDVDFLAARRQHADCPRPRRRLSRQ